MNSSKLKLAMEDLFSFKIRSDFECEVFKQLLLLQAKMLTRMWVAQAVIVSAFYMMIFPYVTPAKFFAWCTLSCLAEILRVTYGYWFLANPPKPPRVGVSHRNFAVLAALSGFSHGLSALFLPELPAASQILLTLVLYIIPAAGALGGASTCKILAAYTIPDFSLNAYALIKVNPELLFPDSILTILYVWFILMCGRDTENVMRNSITIRQEREQLVSELKASIQKTEQASQARARVLAAASHDLRQPMHALSVYSAVLMHCKSLEALAEIAQNIDRLVRSLGSLIHGLLDLSQLSADYYQPERQLMALDKVIENVCNEYTSTIAEKRLILIKILEPIQLVDDILAITRITRNLLDNAIKYTDSGIIRVYTRVHADRAQLIVEDTGKGIPQCEQSTIFEEFYQLNNPGRDNSKGVGLGLTIVQRLAELINAQITLTSELDKGSSFCVSFDGEMVSLNSSVPNQGLKNDKLRDVMIYLIDDEEDILRSSEVLFKTWHIQVKTAISAQAGEALFKNFGVPNLLIVDLRLRGEEHGADLALRLLKTYGNFPVLVITGETASEALNRTYTAGFQLLQKPISPESLFDALCKCLIP